MTDGKGQYITQCYLLQFLLCGFFFSLGSHTYIFSSKKKNHSQNARQLLTPPVLLKSKWLHFLLTSESFKWEVHNSLSTRDTFQMSSCHVSHHSTMVLAILQKHSKYLVIQKDAVLLSPIEKKITFIFFFTDGTFWWNVVINFSQCQLKGSFWFIAFVVHVSKPSWRKLLASIQYLQEDILFPRGIWVLISFL